MASILEQAYEIRAAMDSAGKTLNDNKALECREIYPLWDEKQVTYALGDRVRYLENLYKCITAHASQADWAPDVTASLWTVIDVEHAGTIDDPIPAQANMEYYKDKYYVENGVLYLCTRDSGIPLQHLPSELVGQYFEVVSQ